MRSILMGYAATIRAMQAAERRQQREAQRELRELQRRAKEQEKLSAKEQARLEVDTWEKNLEVLLSVHKEQGQIWDWRAIAAALPPPCPKLGSRNEHRARQRAAVLPPEHSEASAAFIEQARLQDEADFQKATQDHAEQIAEWEKLKNLAKRILAGEHKAFTEALVELNPFAEIAELGSAIHFAVHTVKLVECTLKVNGKQVIPTEVKTLTSADKLSVKPMPKGRFQEIYQDYLCGCVLRVAREIFALFPVDRILLAASVDSLDAGTGRWVELPVLSVAIPRPAFAQLDFSNLDPSDAIENFHHRGHLKTSRKSESFLPIIPLTPAEIEETVTEDIGFDQLRANVQKLRDELRLTVAGFNQSAVQSTIQQIASS